MKKVRDLREMEVGSRKTEVGRPKSEVGRQKAKAEAKAKSEESSCWHWSLGTAGVQSSEFKVQSSEFRVQNFKKLIISAVLIAVDFSQRIKKHILGNELQPHILKMWQKPVFDCNYSVRQLKQTACPDCSGAKDRAVSNLSSLSFAVDFNQRIKKHIVGNGLQPHISGAKDTALMQHCQQPATTNQHPPTSNKDIFNSLPNNKTFRNRNNLLSGRLYFRNSGN